MDRTRRTSVFTAEFRLKAFTHYMADEAADDGAGDEFGEPVDADGDAESDVESVGEGGVGEAAVAGVEGDEAGGHGEGDGGVG